MTDAQYTDRRLTTYTVKESHLYKEGDGGSVTTTDSTGFGTTSEIIAQLPEGTEFELETKGFSLIAGIRKDGVWLMRKSDEDLEEDRRQYVAKMNAERAARLAKNAVAWQERQDALPEWVRKRIEFFHEKGGRNFELSGWEYELAVAELAVLYNQHGIPEDGDYASEHQSIKDFAEKNGTSGNQHGAAKSLALAHQADGDLAGTVSALSPLTGDPFYEREG